MGTARTQNGGTYRKLRRIRKIGLLRGYFQIQEFLKDTGAQFHAVFTVMRNTAVKLAGYFQVKMMSAGSLKKLFLYIRAEFIDSVYFLHSVESLQDVIPGKRKCGPYTDYPDIFMVFKAFFDVGIADA